MQINKTSKHSFGSGIIKLPPNISSKTYRAFEGKFGQNTARIFNTGSYNYHFFNKKAEISALKHLEAADVPYRLLSKEKEIKPKQFDKFANEPFEVPVKKSKLAAIFSKIFSKQG